MKKGTIVYKHELVPSHTKLSKIESEKVLKLYNITIKDLPKITKDDPVIANLDVKPGDIIKIVRKSKTAGECVFYRGVLNA